MLCREVIAVYSEKHMKPIQSGKNAELLTVKAGGKYSYQWAVKSPKALKVLIPVVICLA